MELLFVCCLYLSIHYGRATGQFKSTVWTSGGGLSDTEEKIENNVRSKLECAARCKRYSHCGAFSFDKGSRTCHLYPVQEQGDVGSSTGDTIFWDTAPICQNATVPNATVITWRRSLTSLEVDVTCDDDFIGHDGQQNVTSVCDANGDITPSQTCLQYIWRNLTIGDLRIPFEIYPGWKACIGGHPTAAEKFRSGTSNVTMNSVFHATYTFLKPGVTCNVDKVVGQAETITNPSFPFRVGETFAIVMEILDAAHTYSLRINGVEFTQRTSVQALSNVHYVYVGGDAFFDYVNVWC